MYSAVAKTEKPSINTGFNSILFNTGFIILRKSEFVLFDSFKTKVVPPKVSILYIIENQINKI